jgi:hypothetical protein
VCSSDLETSAADLRGGKQWVRTTKRRGRRAIEMRVNN